jgi:hypothetical protein
LAVVTVLYPYLVEHTVTLNEEHWKVIGFLVRKGAMSELEASLLQRDRHKDSSCITGFVDSYRALAAQLPDVLPQVPDKENVEQV